MTPNNRSLSALAGFVAALALASPADASLSKAVPFDQKVDQAEAIVLGKVANTRSEWDPQHRFIITYTTLRVEKAMKGQPAQEVTVVTPGGTVGEIHQSSVGIPSFREGDDQVVFVKNTTAGPTVLYFDQGAYDVRSEGGERVVAPIATGAVHLDTQRGMAVAPESARPLREFERDVRESMDRTRAQKMELIRARATQQQRPSLTEGLLRYKFYVAVALAGILFATWQFLRSR